MCVPESLHSWPCSGLGSDGQDGTRGSPCAQAVLHCANHCTNQTPFSPLTLLAGWKHSFLPL